MDMADDVLKNECDTDPELVDDVNVNGNDEQVAVDPGNKGKKVINKKLIIGISAGVLVLLLAVAFLVYNNSSTAKFNKFAEYVQEEGSISIVDAESSIPKTVTIECTGNNTLKIKYVASLEYGNVGLSYEYETSIKKDSDEVTLTGTSKSWSGILNSGAYTDSAVINISEYVESPHTEWDTHSYFGADFLKSFNCPNASYVMNDMIKALQQVIAESGVNVTLKDLGFDSYETEELEGSEDPAV